MRRAAENLGRLLHSQLEFPIDRESGEHLRKTTGFVVTERPRDYVSARSGETYREVYPVRSAKAGPLWRKRLPSLFPRKASSTIDYFE